MKTSLQRSSQLIFRILFSLIFIVAGAKHLFSPDDVVARLATAPGFFLVQALPPKFLVILSGGVLLVGGAALLAGVMTRWAAAALVAVLIPITLTVQVGGAQGMGPLMKNIALLGGLLHWAVEGGGALSLDSVLKRTPRLQPAIVGSLVAAFFGITSLPALAGDNAPAPRSNPADTRQPKTGARTGERVFLLVQQPPQLKAALATGQDALAGRGFPAIEVEVLVCGPAINALLAGDAMESKIEAATNSGVRVVACGLTLAEKGIAPEKLSPHVRVVANGLVEALKRQSEGFRSVEL